MLVNVGLKESIKIPKNIERTRQIFERSAQISIKKAAQQVGIKQETSRQIVVTDLQLFIYRIQIHEQLNQPSEEFVNTIVEMIDNN